MRPLSGAYIADLTTGSAPMRLSQHQHTLNPEPLKMKKWTLTVSFWDAQAIVEVFAVGETKRETLANWFRQRYAGRVPEGACLPSKRDLIALRWERAA